MNRTSRPWHASYGFTIVELLVVIGVLSILLGLAGPALSGMVVSQQLKNASLDLASSLTQARSEALTRNVSVTVAPLEPDWARGWTVTAQGGAVLRRQSAYGRIAMSGPVNVIFNGDGRPNSTATPFAVTAVDATVENYRCIRLRLNGRSNTVRGAC